MSKSSNSALSGYCGWEPWATNDPAPWTAPRRPSTVKVPAPWTAPWMFQHRGQHHGWPSTMDGPAPWTAPRTHFLCAQTSSTGPIPWLALGAVVFDQDGIVSMQHKGLSSSPMLAHERPLLGRPSVEGLCLLAMEQLSYTWIETRSWGSQLDNSTTGYVQPEGQLQVCVRACQSPSCPALGMGPSRGNEVPTLQIITPQEYWDWSSSLPWVRIWIPDTQMPCEHRILSLSSPVLHDSFPCTRLSLCPASCLPEDDDVYS